MLFNKNLYEKAKNGDIGIAIFGGGNNGKLMSLILSQQGISTRCFIDNDPAKNGKVIIDGIKCMLPNTGQYENMVCIIAAREEFTDEIYAQAVKMDFVDVRICTIDDMALMVNKENHESFMRFILQAGYGRYFDSCEKKFLYKESHRLISDNVKPILSENNILPESEFLFNYIIFANPKDYHIATLYDILWQGNVKCFPDVISGDYTPISFTNRNKLLCFIFYDLHYNLRLFGFYEYLKSKYPNCKMVYLCLNNIDNYFDWFNGFDIDYLKSRFDLIITYNLLEAKTNNITFHPHFHSKIYETQYSYYESDVFFIGYAKNRLDTLHEIFELLTDNDLKCDFYISEVPEEKQIYKNQIKYNIQLPYKDILEKILNTKCILEVAHDVQGITMRTIEALMYDKKLVSNTIIRDSQFFNENNIVYFEKAYDIDIHKVKENLGDVKHGYAGEYSPYQFLAFIDRYFKKCNC